MSEHVLERTQLIARSRAQVFAFFADAHNLEVLTPPWLRFGLAGAQAIAIDRGTLIAYRMRVRRIPVRWLTLIEEWQPEVRFVDRQLRGPYRLWHHTHVFEEHRVGTLMHDRVRYALPFGVLGELAHLAFVRRDLEAIFDYRHDMVRRLLG